MSALWLSLPARQIHKYTRRTEQFIYWTIQQTFVLTTALATGSAFSLESREKNVIILNLVDHKGMFWFNIIKLYIICVLKYTYR